ncbi:MAG: hypothetical protein JW753_03760, partial [Dehalococcoidia bacterium]|nr:hypothetical protein [Dehalococcoidia bacterium]
LSHYVLRQSLDEISRRNGYLLLTDGMHMNSRGAAIIADQIEAYLRDNSDGATPTATTCRFLTASM